MLADLSRSTYSESTVMSLPTCRPCDEAPVCNNPNTRYSLQDDIFFFVGGGAGSGRNQLFLACCDGILMRQDFPLGISANERAQLIQDLVGRCVRREPFCDGTPPSVDCVNPPCDTTPLTNNPQTCTANCPGGDVFSYTVPAGVFVGTNQEELDRLAHELACQQAQSFIICLADWQACACVGTGMTARIPITSNNPPFSASVTAGVAPPGMRVVTQGNFLIITGVPAVHGTYGFTVRVVDPLGNAASKSYVMSVLEIETTSVAAYSTGVAYSQQLVADGGSGNYSWRVVSGTLPDGLVLSTSGLISGTPTGLGGGGAVEFEVVDTNCEAALESILPPRVSMQGISRSVIRTIRGWPAWTGFNGTLYKTATFAGEEIQTAFPSLGGGIDGEQCAGAKYELSGASEIDEFGRVVSTHTMELFLECTRTAPALREAVLTGTGGFFLQLVPSVPTLLGYCWDTDPTSCASCNTDDDTWVDSGNRAIFGAPDFPRGIINLNTSVLTDLVKSVSGHNESGSFNALTLDPALPLETFPRNTANGRFNVAMPFVVLLADGAWSCTLSNEYTAADANASAIRYTTTGFVAENRPNFQSQVVNTVTALSSKVTTVTYLLNCTQLVEGRTYRVTVTLTSSTGVTTTVSTEFEATGVTQQISGVIPTPAANTTIRVSNARIQFVPPS